MIFLDTAVSTNDRAIETGIDREDPEGIVIVADTQTHGRGRFGRDWISPPGLNLYFTVLLKPSILPREAQLMTMATAAAVATAIRRNTGLRAEIKWPNDIMINNKKAGGILTEMKTQGNAVSLLIAGVGINVNMPLSALPEDIRGLATSLMIEKGGPVSRPALLSEMLAEIERSYKNLLKGNKRALINDWLGLNSTIGNNIRVRIQDRVISGFAEGISDTGELLIRLSSGEIEAVSAGEVTIMKE